MQWFVWIQARTTLSSALPMAPIGHADFFDPLCVTIVAARSRQQRPAHGGDDQDDTREQRDRIPVSSG